MIEEKIIAKLEDLLLVQHKGGAKTTISTYPGRLNFACPYCGDSANDPFKKRGNLYLETFRYKCFNCEIAKPMITFFNDFDTPISLSDQEYELIKSAASKMSMYKVNAMSDYEGIDNFTFDRKTLLQRMGAEELTKQHQAYLINRRLLSSTTWEYFASLKGSILIFNLSPAGKVVSFTRRYFGTKNKYSLHTFKWIFENHFPEISMPEGHLERLNEISKIFNILKISRQLPITVFEGALDAMMFPNSVATYGAGHKNLQMDNVRYFQDNDATGIKMAIEHLNNSIPVFMWKKFLDEHQLPHVKDLNELRVKYPTKQFSFEKYFSNDVLNMLYL